MSAYDLRLPMESLQRARGGLDPNSGRRDVGHLVVADQQRGPCGRRAQKLRLFEGRPACGHCVRAAGMQYRSDMCSHFSKRAALTAPKRIERLNSDIPARLHPRPGRMLDKRANLELRLKRSLIVQRRAAVEQFEKDLRKP